ncbi:MAG TPA: hypothetical protein VGL19_13655 [Polyangiaceae bacterium]
MRKSDWPQVMAAARRKFGPDNPYGVCAFGIDRKVTSGRMLSSRALNVYVVQKHAKPERPVPALVLRARGLRVIPDVIGVGVEPRVHDASQLVPPMLGLYAGAAIHAQGRIPQFGGVAAVLGVGNGPSHLLTAGHLFPTNQPNVEVMAAPRGDAPTVVGVLTTNLLDPPFSDEGHPLDVALVALNADGIRIARQSQDGPRLKGVIASDAEGGISVTAFLSTAHDCSRATQTLDGPLDAHMQSPARGTYLVQQVVGTRAVLTNHGDSGTILYNGSLAASSAVGVCVGQFGAMSIFEPFDRALSALRARTGLPLDLT